MEGGESKGEEEKVGEKSKQIVTTVQKKGQYLARSEGRIKRIPEKQGTLWGGG